MACTAITRPWTMLDHAVNRMRLRCFSGTRLARRRKTPSVA
jgi:hypothetical protein